MKVTFIFKIYAYLFYFIQPELIGHNIRSNKNAIHGQVGLWLFKTKTTKGSIQPNLRPGWQIGFLYHCLLLKSLTCL